MQNIEEMMVNELTKEIMCGMLMSGEITDDALDCLYENERVIVEEILSTEISRDAVVAIYNIVASREIKPCPFCGNNNAPRHMEGNMKAGWFVICDATSEDRGCGAKSGWGNTPVAALNKWNKRAKKENI